MRHYRVKTRHKSTESIKQFCFQMVSLGRHVEVASHHLDASALNLVVAGESKREPHFIFVMYLDLQLPRIHMKLGEQDAVKANYSMNTNNEGSDYTV